MLDTNKHHITKEPVPESKAQQLVPEDVILPRNALQKGDHVEMTNFENTESPLTT